MKIKTLLWLSLWLLVSCSHEVKQEPLLEQDVVVAFGDSLTFGFGTTPENSYPSQLNKLMPQTVINAGVSGEETSGSLRRIDTVLQHYHPALVLLCIGGNDFLRRRSKEQIRTNIGLLIDKIHQSGARVVLIAVPDLSLFLSPSTVYTQIAESHRVLLIEGVLSELMSNNQLKSDTVHLNAKGYGKFATKISEHLKQFGLIN